MPAHALDPDLGERLARCCAQWLTGPADEPHIEVFGEVASTNAIALTGPRAGRVVVAAAQTQGRGRRSRAWASPPGSSLSLSVTLAMGADPDLWGWLPLLTAVAAVDALTAVGADRSRLALKWPNDVLAEVDAVTAGPAGPGRGKLCGILCETDGAGLVVCGIGVNVALSRDDMPVPAATSLRECGWGATREDLAVALVEHLGKRYAAARAGGASFAAVRADYRALCSTIGTAVEVQAPAGSVLGTATDVARDGQLVVAVETGDGPATRSVEERRFSAGDIVHLRPLRGGRS